MKYYLLDSHTLIWAITDDTKLSENVRKILQNRDNVLLVSAVSLNYSHLPLFENHKDPFDRMLIYQCIKNDYTLVSKDDKMEFYEKEGLKCIW